MIHRHPRRMILAGLALAAAAGLVGGACETPLAWTCTGIQGECTCYITAKSDAGQGGAGTLVGDCDETIVPGANCCFAVDADGKPALCTCSADACKSGYKATKNCSNLAQYL